MAEKTPETAKGEAASETKEKGSTIKKLLVVGVPTFLVQLVVIYFLTAKFIVPMTAQQQVAAGGETSAHGTKEAQTEEGTEESESGDSKEQHIFVVKDLIINPSGTNGQRYLLSTIAFNLSSEEAMKVLEKKEMAVRDMLNSTLTAKTMEQLIDVSNRDSLRHEIANNARKLLDRGKLVSVYFSKYVIQ